MTLEQWQKHEEFPVALITLCDYEADRTNLKKGDPFIAVSKIKIGEKDWSFLDENGHPHYHEWCDFKYK